MQKLTLIEKQPEADSEILFKSKKDNRILLAIYWSDCKYLVGVSAGYVEDSYEFEDVEWWCYTKDL